MCDLYQRVKNEGRVSMLVELVNKKLLEVEDAAKQLNISEEVFVELMRQ